MTAATPGQAADPMKLYLAGPMRGIEDRNFPAFADAAGKLRADGHLVYNPAENDAAGLRANLAADTAWISLVADGVVFLPGWAESRGAAAENALRLALGLPGWELESFPRNTIPGTVAAQEPHAAAGEVATPAVTRPSYGDVLVLAVGEDFPAERAQQLQDMLAGLNQGVAVTTVRGVEALRAWQPQPAPELAAAMDAPAALARVLSWFEQFGTRRTAIATRAQLAHAYQDGGLTVPEELRRFL